MMDSDFQPGQQLQIPEGEPYWLTYLRDAEVAIVGTGGCLWPSSFQAFSEGVAPTGVLIRVSAAPQKPEMQVRTIPDQVAEVKAAFGLSVSQLAAVMGVKRPTIYSWFNDEGTQTLRRANRERIFELSHYASEWNERSLVSAQKYISVDLTGDGSLLELLCKPALIRNEIYRAFDAMLEAFKKSDKSAIRGIGARLRDKGYAEIPRDRGRRKR
jgi:hypothetical protein